MKVDYRLEDSRVLLTITGNINLYELHYLRDVFELIQDKEYERVILDMTHVDFIDSSGIGLLIVQATKCKDKNRKFILVNLSNSVDQIFKIASFKKLFIIKPTLETAFEPEP